MAVPIEHSFQILLEVVEKYSEFCRIFSFSLIFSYPKGSFKPANSGNVGGTGFYATPIDLSKARRVTLEYKIFFESGFDFVKGGKLPGLFGILIYFNY